MAAPPAIQVRHLSKVYELGLSGRSESLLRIFERRVRHPVTGRRPERERFVALDDLSFDVAEGEAVGVVGRNGAGKSTLLKIISRITPPSAGYIDLRGNLDFCIAIRTLLLKGGKATLQAGAGIVADSDPASEERETEAKAQALFEALNVAGGLA